MEYNDCINWEPLVPDNSDFNNTVFDCSSCKHFLLLQHATSDMEAIGRCDLSPKSSKGGD